MKDDLGKRMKDQYESRTRYLLPRRTYTIIRLDGKAFHTFTRGMKRPFDEKFIQTMNMTAKYLCENIQGCKLSYVQSDEISLLLTDFATDQTAAWFDGNIQKITSVSASLATGKFNAILARDLVEFEEEFPEGLEYVESADWCAFFDARVFTIPDPIEVENYFVWRQKDAVRNSISMLAQSLYSHKELHGKSQADLQDMIIEKGENWNNIQEGFKRGRTIIKREGNWVLECPDFLKDREVFSSWIPKINES